MEVLRLFLRKKTRFKYSNTVECITTKPLNIGCARSTFLDIENKTELNSSFNNMLCYSPFLSILHVCNIKRTQGWKSNSLLQYN